MTWWGIGVSAVSTGISYFGGQSQKKRAQEQARADARRANVEADLREKDLFAEYEASVEQQRDALAKRELADKAEKEMLRQAQLARVSVDVDLAGGALDGQQRAARRRNFFEDV
jgi:hypothetical protein